MLKQPFFIYPSEKFTYLSGHSFFLANKTRVAALCKLPLQSIPEFCSALLKTRYFGSA